MALTGSEDVSRLQRRLLPQVSWSQLKARLLDAEHLLVQRLAGTVFMIRVASAVLAFGSQVLFARWMGSFQFGIYVYVWTWVLLLGQAIDLGLGTAAQRFIPEYRERGLLALLRGFVCGSRWVALAIAMGIAALAAGGVHMIEPWLDSYIVIPLYLACMIVPAYALANVQEGIARSYDWIGLAMMPAYVVRQLLLTVLMATAYFAQLPMTAVTAMIVAGVSIWLPTLGQLLIVNWRLSRRIERGPKSLRLQGLAAHGTAHPDGRGLLFAACLLRCSGPAAFPAAAGGCHLLRRRQDAGAGLVHLLLRVRDHGASLQQLSTSPATARAWPPLSPKSIKWTFWPSLAATALLLLCGRPILALFGPQFTEGYHLLFILAVGLLARAAIGPIERLLNMLGEQRICALVYAGAFAVNIGLCFVFIPYFGMAGAAIATASALVLESILLFTVTRSRLGFHVFVWGRAER